MFSFTGLLVILKTQKVYTRPLSFYNPKVYIYCVLNFKGWDYSQKPCAGHKQNGTLKDSELKITYKNTPSMHSLEQVITVATN